MQMQKQRQIEATIKSSPLLPTFLGFCVFCLPFLIAFHFACVSRIVCVCFFFCIIFLCISPPFFAYFCPLKRRKRNMAKHVFSVSRSHTRHWKSFAFVASPSLLLIFWSGFFKLEVAKNVAAVKSQRPGDKGVTIEALPQAKKLTQLFNLLACFLSNIKLLLIA